VQLPPTLQQVRSELAKRNLTAFCKLLDPRYESARHIRELCEHLEAVERGDIKRLMVFEPPRHSKTYHVSERFPAWAMGRKPTRQLILASYAAELAEGNSRRARNLLLHPHWPFATRLAQGSTAVNRWHTTDGGVVIAAGVGGGMTGFGADILIVDDPLRDRADAESETVRARQWGWYTDVARTRLMPGAAIVLTSTRWHADDLPGRILNSSSADQWIVLNMPALAEQDDQLGRLEGEPLWPEWYGLDALNDLKRELGSRGWLALYQQRPTSAEGGLFKRDWWQRFDPLIMRRRGLKPRILVVDAANKAGVANDFSVATVWGKLNGFYYVMDLWRERVEYPALKQRVRDLWEQWKVPLLIEDAGNGIALIQDLRRPEHTAQGDTLRALPVLAYDPGRANKIARATVVTPIVEARLVHLPTDADWVRDWIEEHAAFPSAAHDDQVDNTTSALGWLEEHDASSDTVREMLSGPLRVSVG